MCKYCSGDCSQEELVAHFTAKRKSNECCKPCCSEPRLPGRGGCLQHACRNPKCDSFIYNEPSDQAAFCGWCEIPKCAEEKCDLPCTDSLTSHAGRKAFQYCELHQKASTHKCCCQNCSDPPASESTACINHKCAYIYKFPKSGATFDCVVPAISGSRFCQIHICEVAACSSQRQPTSFYCILHKCRHCSKLVIISHSCKEHLGLCQSNTRKSCLKPAYKGGKMCWLHLSSGKY